MAIIKVTHLDCDVCRTTIFEIGFTASELRRNAKKAGWKRVNGQDVCPKCQSQQQ